LANRYLDLDGTQKINETYQQIPEAFARVQNEMDTNKATMDGHIGNGNLHTTAAEKAKLAGIATGAGTTNSATDTVIGNRTATDTVTPGFTGTLTALLSSLFALIKGITGKGSALTAPAITLEATKAHVDDTVRHITADERTAWGNKVDKVSGKQLSTEDYSAADKAKLAAIAAGAEVNQNAFAQVNNIPAGSKSDTVNMAGGTGITITTNPSTKTLTITATGTSTPGAHASSHLPGGSDPIPLAEPGGASGLMSGADAKQLADLPPVPITLSPGLQRIDSDRQARLAHVGFAGRTLVNILGRDGGCESLAPFTPAGGGGARELSTSIKKSGNASIKFAAVPGSGQIYTLKDYAYTLESTKYYLLTAWVYIASINTSSSISFTLSIRDYGTLTNRGVINADTSKVGTWQLLVLRIPINQGFVGAGFRLLFGITTNTGTPEGVAYFDEISLYEITGADYNAIGSMTPEQVAAKWPYTEGISNVDNVYVKRYGRNLLKGVPDTLHSAAKLNAPYDVTIPTGGGQTITRLSALGSTAYRFTVNAGEDSNRRIWIQQYDASGVKTTADLAAAIGTFINFTTQPNTVTLAVIFGSVNTGGPYRFRDWQLVLNSTDVPFTPNDDQSLYAYNVQAAGSVDGSVADQVYTDTDGRLRVRRLWGRAELSGSLGWSVYDKNPTNKILACAGFGSPTALSSRRFIKNDGKVLTPVTSSAGAGADSFSISTANTVLTVDNGDAGWGFDFNPSIAEAQAYFFGYRMNNGTFGTPYNNTGTKTWTRWDATSNVGAVTTVPTTQAAGYTPYQLQYQLAAPVDEPISQEGAITLLAGGNQVEMGSGVIVREVAKPQYLANENKYFINNTITPLLASRLSLRLAGLLSIYKDQKPDSRWVLSGPHSNAYGNSFLSIPAADYDPSAVYTVTYMALDTYLTGIAPLAVTGDRAANTRGNVDEVIDTQVDMLGRLDVLDSGMQSAFQHGVERKTEVVAVLNAKGIAATTAESWDSLIGKMTGIIKATGNALPAEVLAGKEFSTAAGNAKLGTMPNNGTKVYTPTSGNVPIDAGYHVGSVVAAVAVPADKVLAGTTIAGTAGAIPVISGDTAATAINGTITPGRLYMQPGSHKYWPPNGFFTYKDDPNFIAANIRGDKTVFGLQGSMPVRGDYTSPVSIAAASPVLYARIPGGAYVNNTSTGYPEINIQDPNFIASNIRAGVGIFGLVGSMIEGKRWAAGNERTSGSGPYQLSLSGIGFRPRIAIISDAVSMNGNLEKCSVGIWTDQSGLNLYSSGWLVSYNIYRGDKGGASLLTWTPNANGIVITGGYDLGDERYSYLLLE
jgi:hypothetical protein